MATRRYLPQIDTKSWLFVLVLGALLAIIALLNRGSLDPDIDAARADGSTGCQLEVTIDELNVRAGPAEGTERVGTFVRGQLLDGTTTVTDGFRELEDGRWVADQYLTPVPGTVCG